jgi:hypothetical protein
MKKYIASVFVLGVACVLTCALGCNANKNGTVPVTVTVTYNGQPVEEAVVVFAPEEQTGTAANGATNEKGVAKLSSFVKNDGAKPGKYLVTIEKVTMVEERDPNNEDLILNQEVTYHVPAIYGNRAQSGLTAEVTDGKKNEFTFELDDSRNDEEVKSSTSID